MPSVSGMPEARVVIVSGWALLVALISTMLVGLVLDWAAKMVPSGATAKPSTPAGP